LRGLQRVLAGVVFRAKTRLFGAIAQVAGDGAICHLPFGRQISV